MINSVNSQQEFATIVTGGFNAEPESNTIAIFKNSGALIDAHSHFFGYDAVFTKHKKDTSGVLFTKTLDYVQFSP